MRPTVVVGAGVIGLACAYALRLRGRDVIVLERAQPGEACSKGNAGWITPSLSEPLPAPGLTWRSLKWMLRADSPLYISPLAAPSLARWLWRFGRHCNERDFVRGLRAVAMLGQRSFAAFDRLVREGVSFELHRDGLLFVFQSEAKLAETLRELEHQREFGYATPARLDGAAVRRLEPAISDRVCGGFFVSEERHVRPETLCAGYVAKLRELDVEIRSDIEVTGARLAGGRVSGIETSAGPIEAEQVLIAAGAWSGELAAALGVALPVQAGKGYSITLEGEGPRIGRPLYLGESRIGCSPFDGGVRFAGTMELSGVNLRLDPRRVRGIRRGLARYLATPIADDAGIEWVGMRPLTPDGLPLLGRLPGFENIFVATGHAMLGITLAPATAELVADVMTGSAASDALLAPFDPGRFRW